MDDTEDDARYPPNPYPANHHHRHRSSSFPSSARTKMPSRNVPFPPPQTGRRYPKDDEEVDSEEEEDDDEDLNGADRAMDEAEDEEDVDEDDEDDDGGGGSGYRRATADDSSPDSRGKRRKLDKYAMGFEFAPRPAPPSLPRPPSATAAASRPSGRNNPADWSEDSTFVLLDAWGELYIKNGRKSLRSDEWLEVAKKVNETSRMLRSDAQCRNRLDTLKKKYKKEKARMAESVNSSSKWVYFKKMEDLMGAPLPPSSAAARQPQRLPCGVDSGEFVFTNSSRPHLNRSNALDEMRDSPAGSESMGDDDDEESDGLPPSSVKKNRGSLDSSSFRMLAESIQKFGEIYEKMENSKRQHMAELEKMRRQFHRDLEEQKRQILERAQAELAKISQEEGDDVEDREDEEGDEDNNGNEEIDGSAENLSS